MNREPLRDVTEDEVRAFEEDGAVCIRGALDIEWIERLRDAMDRLLDQPTEMGLDLNKDDKGGRFAIDSYMWRVDGNFRALALDSPLAQLAARITRSSRINLLWDFILVKEPHSPYITDWHNDQSANPCNGWQVCGSWAPLDRVTLDSGAVQYIRGSHKDQIWYEAPGASAREGETYFAAGFDQEIPGDDEPEHYEPLPDFETMRDELDMIYFETEPGDVVFQHLLTVHTAFGNTSDRRRRAIAHRWVGDDATYAVRRPSKALIPPVDPIIRHGDKFPVDHHLCPQVWPTLGKLVEPTAA